MSSITAEQLLAKVRSQAGTIAEMELVRDALLAENRQLAEALESAKAQMADVAPPEDGLPAKEKK